MCVCDGVVILGVAVVAVADCGFQNERGNNVRQSVSGKQGRVHAKGAQVPKMGITKRMEFLPPSSEYPCHTKLPATLPKTGSKHKRIVENA